MLIRGDARALPLADASVDCCVTSPPYFGLRDYGNVGQLGLEASPAEYIAALVAVFRELWRVLRTSGTCWLNLGDSYAMDAKWGGVCGWRHSPAEASGAAAYRRRRRTGLKPKDLVMMPARVALALQADGWYLRSDIIWHKPNPMPESVTDRPTKSHEYLFLLTKAERYFYDQAAIAEPASPETWGGFETGYASLGLKEYDAAGVQNPSSVKARIIEGARLKAKVRLERGEVGEPSQMRSIVSDTGDRYMSGRVRAKHELERRKNEQSGDRRKVGFNDRWDAAEREFQGKAQTQDPQDAQRRMLLNLKARREETGTHDNPFGLTRNKRTVWTIPTMPYSGAHFATMPEALVEPCILAGCPLGGLVLDPFVGSGTVVAVAERLGRRGVGVDLSYQDLARTRTAQRGIPFGEADPV